MRSPLHRKSGPVPLVARLIDLAGLLLFLAGAGFYGRAWVGMRELARTAPAPDGLPFAAMRRFDQFWGMSQTGKWLLIASVVVMVAAAAVGWALGRARPDRAA